MAPDVAAAVRLDKVLGRTRQGRASGLHHALAAAVGRRTRDAEMSAMSYNDATNHLLKQWDLLPLSNHLPDDFGCTAPGGGGGDPGGGGVEQEAQVAADVPPPPPQKLFALDPRTRALDVATAPFALYCRRAAESRGEAPSVWAVDGFSPNVLEVLDEALHNHPMPHRAKRAFTFERQLVQARQVRKELAAPYRRSATAPPTALPTAPLSGTYAPLVWVRRIDFSALALRSRGR